MVVLKFGGTSMGSAERILNSASIICGRADKERTGVVVSAVAGVSNRLQESLDRCLSGKAPDFYIESITGIHTTIANELAAIVPGFNAETVLTKQRPVFDEYARLLNAVAAFGECPDTVHCRIMGMGEMLSVPMIAEVIRAKNYDIQAIDSRDYIKTTGALTEGDPVYDEINKAFAPFVKKGPQVLLMTGFVASSMDGKTSLLGRNGSDFSAALMAMGLHAQKLEVWTDVDGIYTADPRVVPDAVLVDEMSYEEAMELSFFGSKVLHPKTIMPIAANQIETWSLNSFNPSAKGTRIAAGPFKQTGPVRGISCLKNVSVINVSGSGMKGKSGIAARIFSAVSRKGVSVLLITQSSSEYTLSFCVRDSDATKTTAALDEEFALEQREKLLNQVSVYSGRSIISIVGDGMKERRGLAATFFDALATADINIHAIAQGSSERSISAVINGEDSDKAVRITHRFFFSVSRTVELCLFGTGKIGGKLLEQLHARERDLRNQHIDIRVLCIANSHKMLLEEDGIALASWRENLETSCMSSSIDALLTFVKDEKPLNPVFVDCTASDVLPLQYAKIFAAGVNVVTPNKIANSLPLSEYRSVRDAADDNRRQFLYETNVGAGLPVIDTLQNMLASGDSLTSFSAVVSGSLSYVFGRLEDGVKFSDAIAEAEEKGFTEPDLRNDLTGADAAKKVLIIAREAGIPCELADIRLDPVFPETFDVSGSLDDFMRRLPEVDDWYKEKASALKAQNKVLRHIVSIDSDGSCAVGVVAVDSSHPLYAVKGGENGFVFNTRRYSPIPLVIRGYGAGADVTAAGVFSDILRTVSWSKR